MLCLLVFRRWNVIMNDMNLGLVCVVVVGVGVIGGLFVVVLL